MSPAELKTYVMTILNNWFSFDHSIRKILLLPLGHLDQPLLRHSARCSLTLLDAQSLQLAAEALFIGYQVILLDFSASSLLFENIVILAVLGGLQLVSCAGGWVLFVLLLVLVFVAVDDWNEFFEFSALDLFLWWYFLIADAQQILASKRITFKVSSV